MRTARTPRDTFGLASVSTPRSLARREEDRDDTSMFDCYSDKLADLEKEMPICPRCKEWNAWCHDYENATRHLVYARQAARRLQATAELLSESLQDAPEWKAIVDEYSKLLGDAK